MGDTGANPGRKSWYKNPVYVVSGTVACVICTIAVGFVIQSTMEKRAQQTAERAWVKVQDATILGPWFNIMSPKRPSSFTTPGRLLHGRPPHVW